MSKTQDRARAVIAYRAARNTCSNNALNSTASSDAPAIETYLNAQTNHESVSDVNVDTGQEFLDTLKSCFADLARQITNEDYCTTNTNMIIGN